MPRDRRSGPRRLDLESLEDRRLMSGSTTAFPGTFLLGRLGHLHAAAIKTDSDAVAAIQDARAGGIGGEWAALIRREIRNPFAVAAGFASGRSSAFSVPGLTFRKTATQSAFTGRLYDQLEPTAAGASVFKGNILEFATILRGEFRDPEASQYVFALDRGAGRRLGPTFASRPGITPDALVTVSVGPYGASPTGTIRDLTDGSIQEIDPSDIAIEGATLRVFVKTGQLPSRGARLARYRFAMWTQIRPDADITAVASFAPDAKMIRIGVLRTAPVRR